MPKLEELLMDILDDNTLPTAEECASIHGMDSSLYNELVAMHALTPALVECKTPITSAEIAKLQSIGTSLSSTLLPKPAMGLGVVIGGISGIALVGITVFSLIVWNDKPSDTQVPTTQAQPKNNFYTEQPSANTISSNKTSPVSENLRIQKVEYSQELLKERETLMKEVQESTGQNKYVAMRNLYRLYVTVHDTVLAKTTLRNAKTLALELQLFSEAQQCEADLLMLTK